MSFPSRYGYGAEHILQMDVVLADGSIATVLPDRLDILMFTYIYFGCSFRTVFLNRSSIPHSNGRDLFFALRGAGSSFAIVTEFLYTVHRTPETRPAIILIWMETPADFNAMVQVWLQYREIIMMLKIFSHLGC